MTDPAAPRPEPLLVSRLTAAALCGVSASSWDRAERAGRIGPRPVRLGGRILYRRQELEVWIDSARDGALLSRAEWLRRGTTRCS